MSVFDARRLAFIFEARDAFSAVAKRVQSSTKDVGRAFDRLEQRAGRAGKRSTDPFLAVRSAYRSLAGGLAAYGVGRAIRKTISEASELELAVIKAQTAIRDPEAFRVYGREIESIIRSTARQGIEAETVGDLLRTQIQQMGASRQAFDNFRQGIKLGTAAFAEHGEAIAALNSLMKAFPELAKDGARAASMLFTSNALGMPLGATANLMRRAGKAAARSNMSPEQTLAFIQTIASQSRNAATGGGVALEILNKLPNPTDPRQIERMANWARKRPEQLTKLGLSGGAVETLARITSADLGRMGQIEKTIRDDFRRGAMGSVFDRIDQSLKGEQEALKASLDELAGVIGKQLLPEIKAIVRFLKVVTLGSTAPPPEFSRPPTVAQAEREWNWSPIAARMLIPHLRQGWMKGQLRVVVETEESLRTKTFTDFLENLDVGVQSVTR